MTKLAKYIIGIAVTAAILFLVWYFGNIVAYILTSAVLAIIGKPMVDLLLRLRIRKFRFPRWLAALLTLATIWALVVTFFSLFIPLVFGKMNELSTLQMPQLVQSFDEPLNALEEFLQKVFAVSGDGGEFSLKEAIVKQLTPIFNVNVINDIFSSIVSIIGDTVVALFSISFITFFFLKEDNLFYNMVVAMFPKKYESNITHAMNSITQLLIRYFTGILAESFLIMLVLSLAFMVWGFSADTAFFMGLVMGILNVIPYIGPLIGGGICVIVGVISPLEGVAIEHMLLMIIGTILFVKGLDDFILQPTLYSNRVNAHPLEIFLVILIAGSVAGVVGMLLAIPAYNVIRVFAKEFFYNFRLVQKLTEKI